MKSTTPPQATRHRRIMFYLARMISAQKQTEFYHSVYDNPKKVRSIWLCLDNSEDGDCIEEIRLNRNTVLGNIVETRLIYPVYKGVSRMDKQMIGKMINHERIRQKISPDILVHGICSVPVLKRLERGERLPDYFVLERLVERLGKSINKLDYLYSQATYEIHFLRESIENNLEQKNFTGMADALTHYETLPEARFPLHWQYICKMRAVLLQETAQTHAQSLFLLEEALRQTVPDFDLKEPDRFRLGEGELVLVLILLQEQVDAGLSPAVTDAEKLVHYIEHCYQDEEARANVYSKAVWVLGSIALA